jgi:hypothetical protein
MTILSVCSQLGNDGLQLYGPTSIFRLAPSAPERPNFNEEVSNGYADACHENPLFNSEIDWARHLPQGVPLTLLEHDRCVICAAASI